MTKKDIEQAISHLQSSIKRRCRSINTMTTMVALSLSDAHFTPNDKFGWHVYHNTKAYRNKIVNQQKLEKKMLKHFYFQLKAVKHTKQLFEMLLK